MENKITSIQVLGSDCPSCHKLFELTKQAVKDLNLEIDDVEYIDDIQKIISMGVMQVPVLAINGKPVLAGSVPDIEKIKSLLTGEKAIYNEEENKPRCSCGGKC